MGMRESAEMSLRAWNRLIAEHDRLELETIGEMLGVRRCPDESPRRYCKRLEAVVRVVRNPGTRASMETAVSFLQGVRSVTVSEEAGMVAVRVVGGSAADVRSVVDHIKPAHAACGVSVRKAPLWWRVLNWASRAWWRAWYRVRG